MSAQTENQRALAECYKYIATLQQCGETGPRSVESLIENTAYVFLQRRSAIRMAWRIFVIALRMRN